MKKDGKDVEDRKWMKDKNGRSGFSEDRCKIWKEHMEKTMNEENDWDHMVEAGVVEGPVKRVTRKQDRSQGVGPGGSPPIEMLFQIFRLNFS